MQIIKQLTPVNHTKGRSYPKILGICNHITAGTSSSALNWFNNPKAQASCTYLVCKNGNIIQIVEDHNTAWCQGIINKPTSKLYHDMGRINPNSYLIGIEHEGTDGTLTESQYQATLWLHKHLISKYNIPISRYNIIGHYELDSVSRSGCPGKNFPWSRLMADLIIPVKVEKVVEPVDEELKSALDILVKYRALNSADYWLENAKSGGKVQGEYAAIVIKKWADIFKQIVELEKNNEITREQIRKILSNN